ncbi:hypothetical protein BCIN_13g01700 [Botrytis cinerea B05.10]|uniref:Uncharacterized protein n=1 Tax=Botryotinia fuckeliana (strain B05.10) TaxID=332648 RepID=A0A384K0E7_BOTFB|nr:hypothetical protein BCIN_13g01700 [Botrytis cinerea B05.10]ATZ56329.1 hypothetical protein BCIN_13g01700 [Botrytis cinerea B05.10]
MIDCLSLIAPVPALTRSFDPKAEKLAIFIDTLNIDSKTMSTFEFSIDDFLL